MIAKRPSATETGILRIEGHWSPRFAEGASRATSELPRRAALRFSPERISSRENWELPSTERLLTDGGDARIVCGARSRNRYGCSTLPEPNVLAFGSSTASTISPAGFMAADALRDRLQEAATASEPSYITYECEMNRLREELTQLCNLGELPGLEIIFGASGTDLHLFASQLMIDARLPAPLVVRVEATETGKGVPDALAGRHFSNCAALGDDVVLQAPLDCGRPIEILEVKCRAEDGSLRAASIVDAEVSDAVARAAAMGRRVLLTVVDVSKTGLLAPSLPCVENLRRRFAKAVEVLVDACQFRLAPSTLKAYLEHDYLVAITGSKFVTGPTFCGALFVPENVAARLRTRALPTALKSYSARADWPRKWAARSALNPIANYGLLLRWEAALTELRAFRELPERAVAEFLKTFATAITQHLFNHPAFELLPVPELTRAPLAGGVTWDRFPTIFSFLLRRANGIWLNQDETKKVHERMRDDLRGLSPNASSELLALRCQVGQPVNCGSRDGVAVSALRLCASTRLIVDALSTKGRGTKAVIADALAVLDKAALLAALPLT